MNALSSPLLAATAGKRPNVDLDRTARPDATLIALCIAFVARDRRACELSAVIERLPIDAEAKTMRAEYAALVSGYHERMQTIADMPARTRAGVLAKADVVQQHWSGEPPPDAELAASIIRDVLAGVA